MVDESVYALGYTQREAKRLEWQAQLSEEILEDGLKRGGLAKGMRVLDLGSGLGDVAFLAARLVGPEGAVVGIDRWAPSLDTARLRAAERGLANVQFVQADLASLELEDKFDAVIGRFILQYLPYRSELLARLKKNLSPGGVVIMQEVDNSASTEIPPSELFGKVRAWIASAFQATGSVHDMGAALPRAFLDAGLPRPQMISMGRVESGPDTPFYDFLAEVLRSVLPVLKKAGAADVDSIDIETLADRLREDALAHDRTLYSARVVTAWAKIG
jgi:ubiquinone/menaquinone biosynthesis C-methylase UbiE